MPSASTLPSVESARLTVTPPAAADGEAAALAAGVGAWADACGVPPVVLAEQAASTRLRVSSGRAALDNRMVRFSCPFLGTVTGTSTPMAPGRFRVSPV